MLENIKLLYVEDEKNVVSLISEILSPFVKELKVAYNGEEALEIYKEFQPDIVLSDIQMPKINGLEMSKKIKALNPKQHIILLTSFNNDDYFQEAIELQVDGYILKPIKKDTLFRQLNKTANIIQLEKESSRNKILYEKYYELSPDIYVSVDFTTNKIINCNQEALDKFGYKKDELIGQAVDILLKDKTKSDETNNYINTMLENTNRVYLDEFEFIRKDGSSFNARITIDSIPNEEGNITQLFAVIHDLTAETLMQFNEKYLNAMFESSKDLIVTTYGDKIDRVNKKVFDFLAYPNLQEFKKERDCICDFFKQKEGFVQKEQDGLNWMEFVLKTPSNYHKVIMEKDGVDYIFGLDIKKLDFDEKNRYLAVFTDITLLIKQLDEIRIKDELLIAQSRQAAMGELIGMIAHQWKQPLSVLSMIASNELADVALNDDFCTKNVEKNAKDILDQVNYLSNTIDEFRDFLKPNKQKDAKLISTVIDETLHIVGKALLNNDIAVDIDLQNNPELYTYTKELIQVLINIFNNSKDAFIENKTQDKKILISATEKDKLLYLTINDNAGGVKEDILSKIFNSYFTTKNSEHGTGIGLYMVDNIITKHLKGTIEAANIDSGLSIEIIIPIDVSQ